MLLLSYKDIHSVENYDSPSERIVFMDNHAGDTIPSYE